MRVWMLAIGMWVTLSGCAAYEIKLNGTGPGYDVYRPEPYVLLSPFTNKEGDVVGYKGSIVWLPDYNVRYRVHSWNLLANVDFKFKDGWMLTGINDKSDNTEFAQALIEAATQLGVTPLQRKASAESEGPPKAILHKIIYNKAGHAIGIARLRHDKMDDHYPPTP